MRHAIYAVTLTCLVSGAALADTTNFKIQTLVSELGGNFGSIDGQIGKMTRQAASAVLGQDVSEFELPELLAALEIAHAKKFDVVANSGAPCMKYLDRGASTIFLPDGSTKEGGSFAGEDANCRTIARLTENSEFRGPVWDKPFLLDVVMNNGLPEILIWTGDLPKAYGEIHDSAGKAHLVRLPVDLEAVFSKESEALISDVERTIPLNASRIEINDINQDGQEELVIQSSREDGRGPDRSNVKMDVPWNQTDVNYIYDLTENKIVPFGERAFSHDLVVVDLDQDGIKEILDFTFNKRGGRHGIQICSGDSLECKWQFQNSIIVGKTSIAFDKSRDSLLAFGLCGEKHTNGKETNNKLCFFDVEYNSSSNTPLKFILINKSENQEPYTTRQPMENWMKFVQEYSGWEVAGFSPDEKFVMGGMGYHSSLFDADADGDLDLLNYNNNRVCNKKDPAREYFEEVECDAMFSSSTLFIQEGDEFRRAAVFQVEHAAFISAPRYNTVDMNGDNLIDIQNFAHRHGMCVDHMATSLINEGNGNFSLAKRDEFMGQYGCEIQSAFFTHNGEPYRVFLSKAKYEKHNFENPEVFVSIEYLGRNSSVLLSDSGICNQAVRLVFSASGKTWKWSEDAEAQEWVNEAKARGLDCGVGADSGSDSVLQTEADPTAPETEKMTEVSSPQSDDEVCRQAIRLVFSSSGKQWKWSDEAESAKWVEEAKIRSLNCGVTEVQTTIIETDGAVVSASDEAVCAGAKRLFFSASGKRWRWSNEPEAAEWVSEAMKRQLDCGIQE